jgi:hypothetical protein
LSLPFFEFLVVVEDPILTFFCHSALFSHEPDMRGLLCGVIEPHIPDAECRTQNAERTRTIQVDCVNPGICPVFDGFPLFLEIVRVLPEMIKRCWTHISSVVKCLLDLMCSSDVLTGVLTCVGLHGALVLQ